MVRYDNAGAANIDGFLGIVSTLITPFRQDLSFQCLTISATSFQFIVASMRRLILAYVATSFFAVGTPTSSRIVRATFLCLSNSARRRLISSGESRSMLL